MYISNLKGKKGVLAIFISQMNFISCVALWLELLFDLLHSHEFLLGWIEFFICFEWKHSEICMNPYESLYEYYGIEVLAFLLWVIQYFNMNCLLFQRLLNLWMFKK